MKILQMPLVYIMPITAPFFFYLITFLFCGVTRPTLSVFALGITWPLCLLCVKDIRYSTLHPVIGYQHLIWCTPFLSSNLLLCGATRSILSLFVLGVTWLVIFYFVESRDLYVFFFCNAIHLITFCFRRHVAIIFLARKRHQIRYFYNYLGY